VRRDVEAKAPQLRLGGGGEHQLPRVRWRRGVVELGEAALQPGHVGVELDRLAREHEQGLEDAALRLRQWFVDLHNVVIRGHGRAFGVSTVAGCFVQVPGG
jgi:hypothetical protein